MAIRAERLEIIRIIVSMIAVEVMNVELAKMVFHIRATFFAKFLAVNLVSIAGFPSIVAEPAPAPAVGFASRFVTALAVHGLKIVAPINDAGSPHICRLLLDHRCSKKTLGRIVHSPGPRMIPAGGVEGAVAHRARLGHHSPS
jgi:hypothetical protein